MADLTPPVVPPREPAPAKAAPRPRVTRAVHEERIIAFIRESNFEGWGPSARAVLRAIVGQKQFVFDIIRDLCSRGIIESVNWRGVKEPTPSTPDGSLWTSTVALSLWLKDEHARAS